MLMKIVDKIKKIVVEPCLEEDESYSVRSRKFIVIAVAIICSNSLTLGVPVTLVAAYEDTSLGIYIVAGALLIATFACSVIPYTYLRITKKLPDWLVDFQIWSTVPATLAFSLFTHQGSVAIACTCAVLVAVLLRVRGWPIMLTYGLATNVLHALINDFGDALPALHETFYHSQVLSVRIIHLFGVNVSPVLFFGLGLYAIMKEFIEKSDQADAAIAMNLAVADKLRRYDTDGVAAILAANKGKVDDDLLEAFTAIQHNLQEYRPHIPDYVIAATTAKNTTEGAEKDDTADRHEDAVINLKIQDGIAPSDIDTSSITDHSSQSDIPNGPLGNIGGDDGSVPDANDSVRSTMSSMRREKDFGGDALTAHFYGRATTVFVRFGGPCLDAATDSAADRLAATLTINTCLEAASKHARAHGGALQYMQGCGLMVSFNAASRVISHERDACLFAEALRQDITPLRNVYVHVSVVTTPVLSFFAGKSGQLMLTVLGNFMPQHTAIHHQGRSLLGATSMSSIVLISSSTMYGLDVNVTARPVGVVTVEGNKGNTISIQLFQVLGLVDQQPNAADDWMYAMERDVEDEGSKQTSAELEGAMKLALADDFSTALDVIRTSTVQDSVVEYITKRLEACLASEVEFPVKVDTHRMW